jgi:hypothetical protein
MTWQLGGPKHQFALGHVNAMCDCIAIATAGSHSHNDLKLPRYETVSIEPKNIRCPAFDMTLSLYEFPRNQLKNTQYPTFDISSAFSTKPTIVNYLLCLLANMHQP